MIEAQINYVLGALEPMARSAAPAASRSAATPEAYNDRLQARMGGTVWNSGGCSSWYLDANGRNTTIWPDFTFRFWRQTRSSTRRRTS